MADEPLVQSQPELPAKGRLSLKNLTLAAYALYVAAILFAPLVVVGVIIAHLKRTEARGTAYEGHMTWLIRTFWITLAGFVAGTALLIVVVGFLVWVAVFVWYVWRLVKGGLLVLEDKPLDDPLAWI